jgi:hypothetical protein
MGAFTVLCLGEQKVHFGARGEGSLARHQGSVPVPGGYFALITGATGRRSLASSEDHRIMAEAPPE